MFVTRKEKVFRFLRQLIKPYNIIWWITPVLILGSLVIIGQEQQLYTTNKCTEQGGVLVRTGTSNSTCFKADAVIKIK
jgi:hypothetical protein